MASDASRHSEQLSDFPVEARTALPSNNHFAARLRGFGLVGILAILLIILVGSPLLSAVLVLMWAWWSQTPWRELGYVRPKNWISTLAVGIIFGSAFKFLLKAVVMPLLGADPINQAYHYLAGNRAAIPGTLFALTVGAGFGEETFFRGYLNVLASFSDQAWAQRRRLC